MSRGVVGTGGVPGLPSPDEEGMVERGEEAYVVEGSLDIGPEELPLVFVGGEGLGGLLLGRMRVTVERLEE